MKTSPIQLIQLFFRTVKVEINEEHAPDEPINPLTSVFNFNGVVIENGIDVTLVDAEHKTGKLYSVFMSVNVKNAPDPEKSDQKFCPYTFCVEAQGLVVALNGSEKLAPPDELVSVNGAAILWSAIREQISAVTARMPYGAIVLPTVHFHDLRKPMPPSELESPLDQPNAT